MAQYTIGLSPDNSKYLNVMARITGLTPSALINRAVDMKREFDKDFMTGFDALLEKFDIPSTPSRRATCTVQNESPDEYADTIATEVYDAEMRAAEDYRDDRNNDDYLRKRIEELKRNAKR